MKLLQMSMYLLVMFICAQLIICLIHLPRTPQVSKETFNGIEDLR